jgi:pimeloyl-ACP methyl ester carboxylesterase
MKATSPELHHEIHGAGEPLILLHGGVGASEMFGSLVPALAARRQVVTVDLQAHGRTPDVDRPLRFELMADDVAALIDRLGIEKADVLGYSLGGGVALRTAIQHAARVRRLVVVSAPYARGGFFPEVLAAMEQVGPHVAEHMKHSPLFALYPQVDWRVLFTKLADLLRRDYDWSGDVAALGMPTMLVSADADSMRPAHVTEFFRLLGGGQKDAGLDGSGRPLARLAVLPGVTHYDILGSPALVPVVTQFLDAHL